MMRPCRRNAILGVAGLLLTLAPASSEAGIIPRVWGSLLEPLGSIQLNSWGMSSGCCYGPSPRLSLFRGWNRGYGGCCNPCPSPVSYYSPRSVCAPACAPVSCDPCGGGYSSNGYGAPSYGTPSYGGGCANGSCGTGIGYSDYGGQVYSYPGYGGGCSSGQCNVNYPPVTTPTPAPVPVPAPSPVTPARPENGVKTGGPSPQYDNSNGSSLDRGDVPSDGFQPAETGRTPAPSTADPNQQEYIPPRVTTPSIKSTPMMGETIPAEVAPEAPAANGAGTEATGETQPSTPPPPARPMTPSKRKSFGEDDEQGNSSGPRLELDGKVAFQPRFLVTRQARPASRVSVHANRIGAFPRMAWRDTGINGLASK